MRLPLVIRTVSLALLFGGVLLTHGFTHDAGTSFWTRLGGAGGTGGRRPAPYGGGAQLFAAVMRHVAQDYVDSLSDAQRYRKAIDGLLEELNDPGAAYVPADSLRRLTDSTRTAAHGGRGGHMLRTTMVARGVADVAVRTFGDSVAREMRGTVDSLRQRGMRTLILDLRGTASASLDRGADVAGLFLRPGQTIASVRARHPGAAQTLTAKGPARWSDLRVIVLVDGTSGGASEVVAGALQDHDRAVILGTATAGQGSTQALFPVSAGAVRLTTARWFTPSGHRIDRADTGELADELSSHGIGGITPNIVAGDTVAARDPRSDAVVRAAIGLATHAGQ
jgi:C-terminal processing protease CtpA/Prc